MVKAGFQVLHHVFGQFLHIQGLEFVFAGNNVVGINIVTKSVGLTFKNAFKTPPRPGYYL